MEIKHHFGVYGVCLQDGKLLCIEKTRGPYRHRFDLPGGSQEIDEGLTETLKREVLEETGYTLSCYSNPRIYDVLVQEDGQNFAVHHIRPFMISYSISNALNNPFLRRFLMEAMIQQMPFGFRSSRLPKKLLHL